MSIFVTGTEFKPGLWKAFHKPGMLTQALPFWRGLKSEILCFSDIMQFGLPVFGINASFRGSSPASSTAFS